MAKKDYYIFKAQKELERANHSFDANVCINKGAFDSEEDKKILKEFIIELNALRGELIIDAKNVLKEFGADYAVDCGFGISTRRARSLKRISSSFYQVLKAEITLKFAKEEISEEEYNEFLGKNDENEYFS